MARVSFVQDRGPHRPRHILTHCPLAVYRSNVFGAFLIAREAAKVFVRQESGYEQEESPKKLRPREIADATIGALEIDDRGFIPELSVFATNPF